MTKIMVVDDDADQTFTVKKSLERLDTTYEVIRADSGMNCLNYLKNEGKPDLILLDIMMPDMSGWEVYEKLQDNPEWKSIPVVFLTARTDRVAREAGKFFGKDYIQKPFSPQDLHDRIEKVLKEK